MGVDIDQLFCASCRSYVHPFLAPCPRCGEARPSRYEEVLGGTSLDVAGLCADPDTLGTARSTLRAGGMASAIGAIVTGMTPADDPVDEIAALLGELTSMVPYRTMVRGDRRALVADGRFAIDGQRVVLRSPRDRSATLTVPMYRVLAVTPIGGRFGEEGRPLDVPMLRPGSGRNAIPGLGGDLVILYATDDGVAQLALANPAGLFATRARPDHFRLVARWLGMTAAASAEREWRQRGPRAHARDLGFDVGPEPAATPAMPGTGDQASPASIRSALEALEELRSGGLVTEAEYAAKRRDILARL